MKYGEIMGALLISLSICVPAVYASARKTRNRHSHPNQTLK